MAVEDKSLDELIIHAYRAFVDLFYAIYRVKMFAIDKADTNIFDLMGKIEEDLIMPYKRLLVLFLHTKEKEEKENS